MTAPTIELPPLAAPVDELWHVLLDLGEQLTVGWALVGGQMVLLHALEHGRVPPQISQDGDVVADVRTQAVRGDAVRVRGVARPHRRRTASRRGAPSRPAEPAPSSSTSSAPRPPAGTQLR